MAASGSPGVAKSLLTWAPGAGSSGQGLQAHVGGGWGYGGRAQERTVNLPLLELQAFMLHDDMDSSHLAAGPGREMTSGGKTGDRTLAVLSGGLGGSASRIPVSTFTGLATTHPARRGTGRQG